MPTIDNDSRAWNKHLAICFGIVHRQNIVLLIFLGFIRSLSIKLMYRATDCLPQRPHRTESFRQFSSQKLSIERLLCIATIISKCTRIFSVENSTHLTVERNRGVREHRLHLMVVAFFQLNFQRKELRCVGPWPGMVEKIINQVSG